MERGVCVITGGGRGIGAATARRAAGAGWHVCLSWHADRAAAESVAREIGGRAVQADASRPGSPGEYVDYAASKGAVDTFTLGLAREVAAEGIRVNAVRPGIVDTGIHASGGQPDRIARIAPTIPARRAGRADEVAAAITWLLGDESPYTTGAILDVTGGR